MQPNNIPVVCCLENLRAVNIRGASAGHDERLTRTFVTVGDLSRDSRLTITSGHWFCTRLIDNASNRVANRESLNREKPCLPFERDTRFSVHDENPFREIENIR